MVTPVDGNPERVCAERRYRNDPTKQGWEISTEENVQFIVQPEEDPVDTDCVPSGSIGRRDGTSPPEGGMIRCPYSCSNIRQSTV